MKRTLCTLTVGALLAALTACTAEAPTGVTLDPMTVSSSSVSDSTAATTAGTGPESSSVAPTTTEVTSEAPTSEVPTSTPVEVTVPPEASALPLPTEQINVPADSPQEEADRAAIEAVWRQVWDLYQSGYQKSEEDVVSTTDKLLIGDLQTRLRDGILTGPERGVTNFGSITLHPYWYQPVGGKGYAVLGDCSDFSAYGEADRTTGAVISQGKPEVNSVGFFVRENTGEWKLWQISNVTASTCSTS